MALGEISTQLLWRAKPLTYFVRNTLSAAVFASATVHLAAAGLAGQGKADVSAGLGCPGLRVFDLVAGLNATFAAPARRVTL
jgi:hypothetical protein